jgi:hypothetical protein
MFNLTLWNKREWSDEKLEVMFIVTKYGFELINECITKISASQW